MTDDTRNPQDELERMDRKFRARRRVLVRVMALMLAPAFLLLAMGGTLRMLRLPSIGFLVESVELSRDADVASWKESVVYVRAADRHGTGFTGGPDGLVITCRHLVRDAGTAEVGWPDGTEVTATVVAENPDADIAILKTGAADRPFLRMETGASPEAGSELTLIGNPLGFLQVANRAESLGIGRMNGRSGTVLLFEGPVYGGNSGSPLLNSAGRVTGMVFARSASREEEPEAVTGYAVTATDILNLLREYLLAPSDG